MAEQFKAVAKGERVFFPRAKNSLKTIQKLLADDLVVLDTVCYDNSPAPVTEPVEADVMIFTSPLNVAAYLDQQALPVGVRLLAIGGRTAAALYQRGYAAQYPAVPSEGALVELLVAV